jgi:hypothetical protein
MKTKEDIKKGCGKIFMWIECLKDERRCGQMEDLKHSEHIILCPSCRTKLKEILKREKLK